MRKTLTIDGGAVYDIASFYDEINRVFMANETWRLGQSLDALDDLLRGGFGAIERREPVTILWRDIEHSKAALGRAATKRYYLSKLERPDLFNRELIQAKINELEAGAGPSYFDIIIEIFSSHPNIVLRPE
ncbi:MAG: ribonuclease inhibitor [Oxalobacteraceae bacterium]|nr:MAG: ribonuclease inhibitor [Oxalobacteraceae bacterium]